MQRWMLLTMAALCALVFVKPVASVQQDDTEPQEYWKTYSLEGIPLQDAEPVSDIPRPVPLFGRTSAFETDNSPVIIYPEDWHPGVGSRSQGWYRTARDFASDLDDALGYGNQEVVGREVGALSIDVCGDDGVHARVLGILEALKSWYAQRAEIAVYRLATPFDGVTMTRKDVELALKSATLIGRQTGDPGESLIWRDLVMRSYVTDYEMHLTHDDVGATLVHREFAVGWEVAAGVYPVGADKLMVQGYFARGDVTGTRQMDADLSPLTSPKCEFRYQPAFAVLGDGEGLVLGGEYLVVPQVRDRFRSRDADGLYIASPIAGVQVSHFIGPAWPGSGDTVFGFPGADFDYRLHPVFDDGIGDTAQETADGFEESLRLGEHDVSPLGPLVVIEPDSNHDAEVAAVELVAARAHCENGPDWFVHQVSLYEVSATDPDPAKGKLVGRFHAAAREGQAVDWEDLRSENYLAGCYPVLSSPRYFDPWIRSAVAGTKFRIKAVKVGEAARIELLAAHAPGYEIKQHKTRIGETVVNTETASAPTTNLRINADLKPGEEATAIGTYPGDESKRLLLVLKRVK